MLYFWILTVILFALPVGLVMLTWDRSQADARECVIRWQIIASALYFLATGPTSQGGETALLMMLLGALIAATALLVRHCTGGHGQQPSPIHPFTAPACPKAGRGGLCSVPAGCAIA